MAKLTARGRYEVFRLHRQNLKGTGWSQRAYRSDGVILSRYRAGTDSPISMWTTIGRVAPELSPRQIADLRGRDRWFPVTAHSSRLSTPETLPYLCLGWSPIVTVAQAQRRNRAKVARALRAQRQIDRDRTVAI